MPLNRESVCAGLRGLEQENGDPKQLEADLAGYARLRVGGYRVVVRFYAEGGRRIARCVFAERRPVVYELFSEILRSEPGNE